MSFRPLLPFALLALALGCQFERLQQVRVAQEVKAIERAMSAGQPLPPLPADHAKFGPYWPILEHMHTQGARLQAASQQVEALGKADSDALRPERLADPEHRHREHERLSALVQHLETALDAEDELVGAKAEAFIQALPIDAEFRRGAVDGFRQKGQKGQTLDLLLAIMRQKRDYYRQVDGIVTLADQGLEGLDGSGKLRFRTHEQVMAYLTSVTELTKAEGLLNADVRRFQAVRTGGTSVVGR